MYEFLYKVTRFLERYTISEALKDVLSAIVLLVVFYLFFWYAAHLDAYLLSERKQ